MSTPDIIGQILWFSMPLTPLVTVPLMWRWKNASKILRVIVALFLAFLISAFFYAVSLSIVFRNGMGPS
jgi:uncharacterized membrane-anchored protein YitT (DUF2179 family)